MNTRRLPLLVLLVLLPVPARADRHFTECFTGVSTEKDQALAARAGCGIRLVFTLDPLGVGDNKMGTAGVRAAADAAIDPADGEGGAKPTAKRSLYLFAEAAEYVVGSDSGHALDGWMLGARYLILGKGSVEPFFHVMGGRQRPSRANAVTAATDWSRIAALGGGVDIELTSRKTGIVPVMRLQFDLADSAATDGIDPYGRATFGVSFRFEGHAH